MYVGSCVTGYTYEIDITSSSEQPSTSKLRRKQTRSKLLGLMRLNTFRDQSDLARSGSFEESGRVGESGPDKAFQI